MAQMLTRISGALLLALTLYAQAGFAATQSQGSQTAVVKTDKGDLDYETCGSGQVWIVLIHDAVLDAASWDGIWPALCARYRVLRYDRHGYGRSPEATGPHSAVDDISVVMKAAGISDAVLVGSSAGGGLALDFALAHPKEVDGLVLAGPEASGQGSSFFFKLKLLGILVDIKIGAIKSAIEKASHLDFVIVQTHEAARQKFVDILTASPQDLTHNDQAISQPSALPRLNTITVPTLILIGDHDAEDNKDNANQIAGLVPGARIQTMADSGHMMVLEQPEAFLTQIIAFMDKPHPVGSEGFY